MDAVEPAYGTVTLLLIAVGAVVLLLTLILRFRLHAFVALVLVSLLTALVTRIPFADVVPTLLQGFGSTLATVALLVGFGAMIGRMLEVSGGAQVLADRLIGAFGDERAPLALGVASLLFGFPIFFDAGLVVMLPIIFSVAHRFGGSVLTYALPAAGAFAVMHAFLPPHPGPVAAGDLLGADIGLLVFVGLVVAIPTWYLGSYLFGLWVGKRFVLPVPELLGALDAAEHDATPPPFGTVMLVLLLPLVLIFLNTGLNTLATMGLVDGDATWVNLLRMIGQTPVALLITVLVAMWKLSGGPPAAQMEKIMDGALGPVCAIILVTGAGGMFGGVLRASGIGQALAGSLESLGHAADRRGLPDLDRAARGPGLGDGGADHHRRAAGADGGGDDRAQRVRPLLPGHRHRLRRDGALPRQRLGLLAGRAVPADGREDHAQDLDGDGDAARHASASASR